MVFLNVCFCHCHCLKYTGAINSFVHYTHRNPHVLKTHVRLKTAHSQIYEKLRRAIIEKRHQNIALGYYLQLMLIHL